MDFMNQPLDSEWEVYHRDPLSRDWSFQSYEKILELRNFGELRVFLQSIPDSKIIKGNISIMRKGIRPVYEDPMNTNGGAWTLKLGENVLVSHWKYYVSYILSNFILTDKAKENKSDNQVNGIVLCPRRGFSVIQLWTKMTNLDYEDFHHKQGVTSSSILFRKHQN